MLSGVDEVELFLDTSESIEATVKQVAQGRVGTEWLDKEPAAYVKL